MCCREVLLGTPSGTLHELVVEEKDKKEKHVKPIFQLLDSKEPISSVYQHQAAQGQRAVIMTTSQRLFLFTGKGSLEALFARYISKGNPKRWCPCITVTVIIPTGFNARSVVLLLCTRRRAKMLLSAVKQCLTSCTQVLAAIIVIHGMTADCACVR